MKLAGGNKKGCITFRCRRGRQAGRFCFRCKRRIYKERHPVKYAFQKLRSNAKRRGKEFDLTFDQFQQFCVKTEYLVGRGRTRTGFHIDRIRDDRGYTMDNIQVLTNTENITKENTRRKRLQYDYRNKEASFVDSVVGKPVEGGIF